MMSSNAKLISHALHLSFTSKKSNLSSIDDSIAVSARRVLSTKIEYVHCPEYSTSTVLNLLKNKYTALEPNKLKRKKKKKRNKRKSFENSSNQKEPMKNTELNGENLSLPAPKVVLFSPDAVQLGWKGQIPVGSGFINLGTTCYINSTLQALFHVPAFVNWLIEDKKHHTACEKMNGMLHTECVVCAMAKTLQSSHRLTGSSIKPRHIIDKVKVICKHLSPFRQEDAHEFLRYLMEAMEKSYIAILGIQARKLDNFSKETTPLNQIFGGYIRTEVTCLECNYVSTTFQHFQDLILDIRQASTNTVYDALENYFSKERLDGDESYHCEHCKKKVSAYKKFSIEKAPNALCIQLKRFNISNFYGGSKISKLISTPHTIDLTKFKHSKNKGASLKYHLVSMVFHHGQSANSGHYTALGCTSNGSFYYFNDEQVYATNLGQYTNNPNAYIMFYELEKSSTTENSCVIKTPAANTFPNLFNGCSNGIAQPRNNGFFIKRDNSCSNSLNHLKQPSWVTNNNEKIPIKSVVVKPPVSFFAKSTSTSLVPYMSSDSESSDSETGKNIDTNNNPRVGNDCSDKNKLPGSSMLSPLAKKNSTLTSLLSSSPQNDNSSYHVTSTSKSSVSDNKLPRWNSSNYNENENGVSSSHITVTSELKTEKRNLITFSMFNRDKKKVEQCEMKNEGIENGKSEENAKSTKQTLIGIATMYSSGKETKKEQSDDTSKNNGDIRNGDINYSRANGIINGGVDKNEMAMMNGASVNGKLSSNGWLISEIEDSKSNTNGTGGQMKNNTSKLLRGEWSTTENGNRKLVPSPLRGNKQHENRENSKKYSGDSNESEYDNSSRNDIQNTFNNFAYSSQNGYGGKVLTWNGDLSYINKEAELQRKEATKRSYSDYDDEMDRGKNKKSKHYSRNENRSNFQSPRKNLVQQYHNNFNRNKRPWHLNQNGHHYNNNGNSNTNNNNSRRYSNNGFHRHNYYGYRHVNFIHQNSWRR